MPTPDATSAPRTTIQPAPIRVIDGKFELVETQKEHEARVIHAMQSQALNYFSWLANEQTWTP